MDENASFMDVVRLVRDWLLRNIRWLTRPTALVVAVFVVLNRAYPPAADWIASVLGLQKPSLAELLSFMVMLFILERVVVLEDSALGTPALRSFETRREAYRQLSGILRTHKCHSADMIQFSGDTVLPLLRDLADGSPRASVRLLLQNPECADAFDSDGHPEHRNRIAHTLEAIRLLEDDLGESGFHVEIGYYDTPPALSTVLIDDDVVCAGWYHTYRDAKDGITRLRGHNIPAVLGRGREARTLADLARRQFRLLWEQLDDAQSGQRSA